MNNDIFVAAMAGAIVYADRTVIESGDYKTVAMLDYRSLELRFSSLTSTDKARDIRAHAAEIQARKGEVFAISTCGQTVVLGGQTGEVA